MGIHKQRLLAAGAIGALGAIAAGQQVSVTIENTNAAGGFSFTPMWVGFHNAGFDSYDGGTPASAAIELLAELGDPSGLNSDFSASAAGVAGGVQATLANSNGAPVFSPGESQSYSINVGDSTINRYFSYASMIVPTNDLFIANGAPLAHELFDAAGNFNGPLTIEIFGREVNDAGTEVNNAANGAAFLLGVDATLGDTEGATIRNFFTAGGDAAYLASLSGLTTADGGTISVAFGADDLIARITIVPAPGGMAVAGMALLGVARRRRR